MSDGPVVGIVAAADPGDGSGDRSDAPTDRQDGPDGATEATVADVSAAVERAGGRPERDAATGVVGERDLLVAVGEPALLASARAGPDVPVLPVGAGRGVRSVPVADAGAAVERLLAGAYETEHHPLLDVRVADRSRARVLADAMLVTADPGEISEYSVSLRGERVGQFRADGVVVATPAGSPDYARRAGGPVVEPGTEVAAVVPVAPFATDPSHWVLPLSGVALAVERDETPVQLLADDRVVGTVDPGEPVGFTPRGSVAVAVVAESNSPF